MSKMPKMAETYAKPDDLSGRSSKWELLLGVLESWQLSHGDAKGGQIWLNNVNFGQKCQIGGPVVGEGDAEESNLVKGCQRCQKFQKW